VDTPEFKVPCSSAHRIRDYLGHLVQRGWKGAYGMMAWNNNARGGRIGIETYGFSINALAEWSWNLDGRTEREFAVAWAARNGYEAPEAVGDWSELMGPVEFDVYDSEFPVCYSWGQASNMVAERERPYLGEGIFRYYTSQEDFDRKIDTCDRALAIARSFENPYLANETAVVRSYVRLAKFIYLVAEQVATDDLATLESQDRLRESLNGLQEAGDENTAAIRAWRAAIGPEPWHVRVHDAIKATEKTVADITSAIAGKYFY